MYHPWIDYIDLTDYEIVDRVIDSPKTKSSSTLSPISLNLEYNKYFYSPPIELIDFSDDTT